MTGYEFTLAAVLASFKTPTPIVPQAANVRRAHRTAIPREKGDYVHLIDGDDAPEKPSKCGARLGKFTVSLFVHSDAGAAAADAYRIAAFSRLKALVLPESIQLKPPLRIVVDTELADADVTRVDIDCEFCYRTRGDWSLELAE